MEAQVTFEQAMTEASPPHPQVKGTPVEKLKGR